MRALVLVLAVLALAGCSGNAAVVEALAKDNATVCVKVTTVWGTLTAARSNIVSGEVTCDGLTVRAPGAVSVPVTVKPVSP